MKPTPLKIMACICLAPAAIIILLALFGYDLPAGKYDGTTTALIALLIIATCIGSWIFLINKANKNRNNT